MRTRVKPSRSRPAPWPALLLLLSGCALVTLSTKRRSWPDDGEMPAPHLEQDVSVTVDTHGVPHVRAQSEADAWYALGAMHARDRLFQADTMRRLAWGRLSEWIGPDVVELDLFWQGLGLRERAAASFEGLDAETRLAIDAYVAGFNAGAASLDALPVEYRLLGVEFEPWTREDCAALVYVNAWALAENPAVELTALALRDQDRDTLDALLRVDPREPAVDAHWEALRGAEIGAYTPEFAAFAEAMVGWGDEAAASNNWAVGPGRSADGMPILANDPHLIQRVPSVWYAADVQGGDLHVAGVTMPGSPFVVIGHTDSMAWGFTNVMADAVDLAVVERDGDGYRLGGERRAFRTVTVEARPKGEAPVRRDILWTEIGPVITAPDAPSAVVLRWQALELDDRSPDLFRGLNRAATAADAIAAVDRPTAIAQNLVTADTSGAYAWQVFGALVRREAHTGRVPYPASALGQGWSGWIDTKPGERDPERGWVRSANAAPDDPDAYAITARYLPDWRQRRVDEVLGARADHTPATFAELQTDRLDVHARETLPGLLEGVSGVTPEARTCRELLLSWDYRADPHATGPSVWAVFQRELIREALTDDLGPEAVELYLRVASPGRSVLDGDLERWLPDRAAGVEAALGRTCTWLSAELGPAPQKWQWGRLHALSIEHPFGEKLPAWNLPAVPYGGSLNTVNQAGFRWSGDDLDATWIASMRLIVPLSDPSKATIVYPGGQSGHPGHPASQDWFDTYLAGGAFPLWYADDDVAANAASTLVLRAGEPRGLGTVMQATGAQ